MTKEIQKPIPLWDSVKKLFSTFDIHSFREIGGLNDRLGTWGAVDQSSRYYRALMFEFACHLENKLNETNLGNDLTKILKRVENQNFGGPPTICFNGVQLSLDYLLGIEEYLFCNSLLMKVDEICEIGAGFGRTCHTFLSLTELKSYTIIDLPEMLPLSKNYLSAVLSQKQFKKIKFVPATDYQNLRNFDLVINIDSLQEMPIDIGNSYLDFISKKAQYFFTKNALGKYSPSDIDLEIKSASEFEAAMEMGIMTEKYKLFDTQARKRALETYHKKYCPLGFRLIKTQRGFGQYLSYELSLFSS